MLKESGEAASGMPGTPEGGEEMAAPAGAGPLGRAGGWLGATLDLHQTARQVLGIAVPHLADAGAVYVLEPVLSASGLNTPKAGRRLVARRLAASAPVESGHSWGDSAPGSDVVIFSAGTPHAHCLITRQPVMFTQDSASRQARFLAVPLTAHGDVTGLLLLGRWPGRKPYQIHDVTAAGELAAQAGVCVDNARLFAQERRIAQALQRGLLPRDPPAPAGLEIAHRYRPAGDHLVGGDWYDVVPLPGDRTAIVVGDAMGHGPEAATVMVQLRAAAHALADLDLTPDALLSHLNRMVASMTQGTFATCVCAVLDPAAGSGLIARAGHLPPITSLPSGPYQMIELPPGLPLGLGDTTYGMARIALPSGSTLVLYTDGLVETRTRDFDVGILALQATLAAASGPLQETCDATVDALCEGGEDDTTLVLVRIP